MNENRLGCLLDGDEPSVQEYAEFASIAEAMSTEWLWKMATSFPKMHWTLRALLDKNLQEKIPKEKTALAMDSVYRKLEERFGQKD